MSNQVITWNTRKIEGGFEFHVYSFGYQVPNTTLKVGVLATRARAMLAAKKWTRFLKSQAAKAA